MFLLSILLIQLAAVSVSAQDRLQSGDTITGVVRDFNDGSSLFAVYVTEIDSSSAVKSWASTDVDGPKAGDTISGVVFDDNGPMMLVNVVERDSNYRIVAHCITDIEGKFSFRLVNPDHRIQVSFVGYKTVDAPIDTTFLNIRMEDAGDLPPVEIISDRVQETGPMPLPIPLREAAKDVDTIDMNLFENLGLYTIDEVLNAKIR